MTIYLIEATSSHKLIYAIKTDKKKSDIKAIAEEMIKNGDIKDFAQKWLGEKVDSVTRVDENKFIKEFDKYNIGEKTWTKQAKLNEINLKDQLNNDITLTEDEI